MIYSVACSHFYEVVSQQPREAFNDAVSPFVSLQERRGPNISITITIITYRHVTGYISISACGYPCRLAS